ncbi:type II toxin-antitoxin system VapC family toxin [Corynebacterium sp. MSK218]|uniref:type II toxin-antitoxin system VapC family toxin n=1 Tax=Corynebacterium sp. MSK218 TaxID=3050218 RepID=UPI0025510EF7|nr:type II toxin-antitoxin system VapC family toxin [Corynebacterium sp. MSK218]MDK8764497.1 type II toxin-antitoxin system VapC family toxin [Corynebacterium sp. MSK218]
MTLLAIDASAAIEFLLKRDAVQRFTATYPGAEFIAPSHMPLECLNVLKRLERAEAIDSATASFLANDVMEFNIELISVGDIANHVWSRRHTFSIYDSAYVAVSNIFEAPLISRDARLIAAWPYSINVDSLP